MLPDPPQFPRDCSVLQLQAMHCASPTRALRMTHHQTFNKYTSLPPALQEYVFTMLGINREKLSKASLETLKNAITEIKIGCELSQSNKILKSHLIELQNRYLKKVKHLIKKYKLYRPFSKNTDDLFPEGSFEQKCRLIIKNSTLGMVFANPKVIQKLCHFSSSKEIQDAEEFCLLGADPDAKGEDGLAALHLSTSPLLSRVLINYGANVDIQDNEGNTPLHHAFASPKIASLLIEHKAQVNLVNNQGEPPLHFAFSKELINLLFESGANINAQDNQGNTFLHTKKENTLIRHIIQLKGDLSIQNNQGNTPLHSMVLLNPLCIPYLLQNGAEPFINTKNEFGNTPLHLASDPSTISTLINSNADVNLRNANNETPFDMAKKHKNTKAYKYLNLLKQNLNSSFYL